MFVQFQQRVYPISSQKLFYVKRTFVVNQERACVMVNWLSSPAKWTYQKIRFWKPMFFFVVKPEHFMFHIIYWTRVGVVLNVVNIFNFTWKFWKYGEDNCLQTNQQIIEHYVAFILYFLFIIWRLECVIWQDIKNTPKKVQIY
jgi:hypothetical protein